MRSESRQDQIGNGYSNGSMICLAKSWGILFTQKFCCLKHFPQLFNLISLTIFEQSAQTILALMRNPLHLLWVSEIDLTWSRVGCIMEIRYWNFDIQKQRAELQKRANVAIY